MKPRTAIAATLLTLAVIGALRGREHAATAQQDNPDLYSMLTQPLPYNGGDANGPCWAWSAAEKADADRMRADWQRCMDTHGGTR